jgi:hypothetical protein
VTKFYFVTPIRGVPLRRCADQCEAGSGSSAPKHVIMAYKGLGSKVPRTLTKVHGEMGKIYRRDSIIYVCVGRVFWEQYLPCGNNSAVAPASYSRGSEFKSRPGDLLSSLRLLLASRPDSTKH